MSTRSAAPLRTLKRQPYTNRPQHRFRARPDGCKNVQRPHNTHNEWQRIVQVRPFEILKDLMESPNVPPDEKNKYKNENAGTANRKRVAARAADEASRVLAKVITG